MTQEFDLYLDESGTFLESKSAHKNQKFANQLVGILAPKGQITETKAENILRSCYQEAGYSELGKTVHGQNLSIGTGYDRLIGTLVEKTTAMGWQPVCLVNKERVAYGDRLDNYVNMVAELALRIFRQKSQAQPSKIILNIYYAIVYLGDDEGEPQFIEVEDYRRALQNYLAFTAVRQGFAAKSSLWKLGNCQQLSANNHRRLQICDLFSNSSHSDYKKCGAETKIVLENAFGDYYYTMIVHLVLEQCDLLIQNGSLGLAIKVLAERLNQPDRGGDTLAAGLERLDSILDKLAQQTASDRNIQLSIITNWLEQLIDRQRSLELGYQLAQWFYSQIHQPLVTRLEDSITLDWFEYALNFWILTACNHQGNLIESRQAANRLVKLIPSMAKNWEQITLLMSGFVADAVHRTDCWEYDTVTVQMKLVADYFAEVSSLFSVALPEVFPDRVRSQLRGKALGTWLQSEIYASSFSATRLSKARELSELCLEEFTTPGDKAIQYQYRCQLETLAREFSTAREYLAKSLNLSTSSHSAIAHLITDLAEFAQGFALLHWLRLGTIAYLSGDNQEWTEFATALKQSKLLNNAWCTGQQSTNYPTHGILRRVALIELIQGERNVAAIGRLRNLAPMQQDRFVLVIIQCAAYAETAAFLWENNNSLARKTLNCSDRDRPGLQQLLETLADKSHDLFPQVYQLTQSWLTVVQEVLVDGSSVKEKLLKLGQQINY